MSKCLGDQRKRRKKGEAESVALSLVYPTQKGKKDNKWKDTLPTIPTAPPLSYGEKGEGALLDSASLSAVLKTSHCSPRKEREIHKETEYVPAVQLHEEASPKGIDGK